MKILTHCQQWHHLDITIVTIDGRAVRAGIFDKDGTRIGTSAPRDGEWTPVAGTSPNLPLVLEKTARQIQQMEDDNGEKETGR